ncbi:MAG TPA: hypothetical protein VE195_04255 [Acidobacteriaceae bacterium]|nr:hypothetical protein [Acidobacteriaceae bacterium]
MPTEEFPAHPKAGVKLNPHKGKTVKQPESGLAMVATAMLPLEVSVGFLPLEVSV